MTKKNRKGPAKEEDDQRSWVDKLEDKTTVFKRSWDELNKRLLGLVDEYELSGGKLSTGARSSTASEPVLDEHTARLDGCKWVGVSRELEEDQLLEAQKRIQRCVLEMRAEVLPSFQDTLGKFEASVGGLMGEFSGDEFAQHELDVRELGRKRFNKAWEQVEQRRKELSVKRRVVEALRDNPPTVGDVLMVYKTVLRVEPHVG